MTTNDLRVYWKRVLYAEANFGKDEIKAATEMLEKSHLSLMGGQSCLKVEEKVADSIVRGSHPKYLRHISNEDF